MSKITQYLRSVKVILEFDDQQQLDSPHTQVLVISGGEEVFAGGAVSFDDFVDARRNYDWAHAHELVQHASSSLAEPMLEKRAADAQMIVERRKRSLQNKIDKRGTFVRVEQEGRDDD